MELLGNLSWNGVGLKALRGNNTSDKFNWEVYLIPWSLSILYEGLHQLGHVFDWANYTKITSYTLFIRKLIEFVLIGEVVLYSYDHMRSAGRSDMCLMNTVMRRRIRFKQNTSLSHLLKIWRLFQKAYFFNDRVYCFGNILPPCQFMWCCLTRIGVYERKKERLLKVDLKQAKEFCCYLFLKKKKKANEFCVAIYLIREKWDKYDIAFGTD